MVVKNLQFQLKSFTLFKTPVHVDTLKKLDEHFTIPQCYLNLENYPIIFNYLKLQECYDIEFVNSHNQIYENNFAMTCKEMEQTKEFDEKDKLYTSQKKYSIVECGYITKKLRR